jgi:tripartite-type tricarboxylate transporter receptor subunit TctC
MLRISDIRAGIVKGLNDPDVRSKLTTAGVIVVGGTPEEFAAHIKSEMAKAEQLIKAANIKPD